MNSAKDEATVPLKKVPQHVGIIMDGNGRWAQARGLPRTAGHRAGTENLREIFQAAVDFGIEILTLYAFSTENWSRPRAEIRALMRLLNRVIDDELDEFVERGVRICHVGLLDGLSPIVVQKIQHAEEASKENERLIVNVAFNYGGRAEIVEAAKRMIADGLSVDEVDEERFGEYLFTAGLPDPDLIIRTGGDMRLSNFLIWQAAYAELYFTPTLWPDFHRQDLRQALVSYQQRDRRFGGLDSDSQ
ncbi:MAG: isoprenyl transferase [Chloroflexota bacterium]|nr:isoprenyl transferase [Chloroflexota bacterium]